MSAKMTRKAMSARVALRKISGPTKSCEIAAPCGNAGASMNALTIYGPGIANPTAGAVQGASPPVRSANTHARSLTFGCGILQAIQMSKAAHIRLQLDYQLSRRFVLAGAASALIK